MCTYITTMYCIDFHCSIHIISFIPRNAPIIENKTSYYCDGYTLHEMTASTCLLH